MRAAVLVFSFLLMSCGSSGGGGASSDDGGASSDDSGGSTDSSDLGAPPDIIQEDEGECTASCDGKLCGDDGCGGSCGGCQTGLFCTDGQCVDECTPNCDGKLCGDNGCGASCGECLGNGSVCTNGQCVAECVPDCANKDCGDNGCGGSCGSCAAGDSCNAGVCETPAPVTYSKDVQPIFSGLCGNCHKGSVPKSCKGSTCLINFYSDTQKSAKSCGGKNVAECSLMRMKSGSMPPGPGQVSQSAIDIVQAWIDGGQLE